MSSKIKIINTTTLHYSHMCIVNPRRPNKAQVRFEKERMKAFDKRATHSQHGATQC